MAKPVAPRRPNPMSLESILCHDPPVESAPEKVTVQEKEGTTPPLLLPAQWTSAEVSSWYDDAPSISQPQPAVVDDKRTYLDDFDFDFDEARVVQPSSPPSPVERNRSPPMLRWSPPYNCSMESISQPRPATDNNIRTYLDDFDDNETRVVQSYSPTSPVQHNHSPPEWLPPDVDCPIESISQPWPAVDNDTKTYLDDFDDDEARVVQPHSPVQRNLNPPLLGWTPPDGSEDVDIDDENLMYLSHIWNPATQSYNRIPSRDMRKHVAIYLAERRMIRSDISTEAPAQQSQTRTVLAHTQPRQSRTSRRTKPPNGGVPPKVAREVTKARALAAELASNLRRAALVRSWEKRRPSVQSDAWAGVV